MEHCGRYRFCNLHYLLIQALFWAAACGFYAFGVSYLSDAGLSSSAAGLVLSAVGILSAIAQPLIAAYAGREGRSTARVAAVVTLPGILLLLCVWRLARSPLLLSVLYILAWMLLMALQFLINSMAMEYRNAGIPVNYGMCRACGSAGYALTSYLLGVLCGRLGSGITVPFSAGVAALLFVALLLWPAPPKRAVSEPESLLPAVSRGLFARYPRFLVFFIGAVVNMIAYCMVCSYLVRLVNALGGGTAELGTAVMIAALLEIPAVLISLWLNRRFGSRKLMIFASVMLSVKMLGVALAPSIPFLYVAQGIQLLSYSLYLSISVYYVNALLADRDRVMGQAVLTLVQTVGNAVGALLGGLLLDAGGLKAMLIFCVIASLAGSVVMILGLEKTDGEPSCTT